MKLMICGKGGSGKSTVSALLALAMEKRGKKVLLMDADESNLGLYRMLGVKMPTPLMESLGGKKGFQTKLKAMGTGFGSPASLFPKDLSIDSLPKDCIAESGNIRVMSTGKIHHFGEGCACPMGNLFRMFFSALNLKKDELVIVDTAAGLEHFGRRLDGECDHILCVTEPSYESVTMAQRIHDISTQAGLSVCFLLNKVTSEILPELEKALEDLCIIGYLSQKQSIFLNTLKGNALEPDMAEADALCQALEAQWNK